MGWPDRTGELARYYPTDLMLTAFDIIFFWVARMIMAGVKFVGDVPFREVYITGLVRDERGQKMSKSRGNVVDPLEVMDEIGADALRFTLTAMAVPGMDIPLSEGRMTGYRQFINKIWNASRFVLMHAGELKERPPLPPPGQLRLMDRWILHRLNEVTGEVNEGFRSYRFDVAADRLYHFFWHEYADWYIELVKPHLQGGSAEREHALAVLLEVHDSVLRLLHPIIPFVTEEIWQRLPRQSASGSTITLAPFPQKNPSLVDEAAARELELLQGIVTTIRTARAERNVKPSAKVGVVVEGATGEEQRVLGEQSASVAMLAGLDRFEHAGVAPGGPDTVTRLFGSIRVHIRMPHGDRDAELEKLQKKLTHIEKELASVEQKLASESFVARAPQQVVEDARTRRQSLASQREKLRATLEDLGD
jgi:valyl-tRNA synthetase